jgi:hypothetical protein
MHPFPLLLCDNGMMAICHVQPAEPQHYKEVMIKVVGVYGTCPLRQVCALLAHRYSPPSQLPIAR